MKTLTRFYVGVDLHKTAIQICVLNDHGDVLEERRFLVRSLGESKPLFDFLKPYRKHGRLSVEALGLNRWFVNALLDGGYRVTVCDPSKLRLKMHGRKTDRRDAREIARRLYLGDIDTYATTWYADDGTYGRRKLLRTRHAQTEQRQFVINQIRALLNAYKIRYDGGLTSTRAIAWLSNLQLATEELTLVLQSWVSVMVSFGESIALLDQQLDAMNEDTAAEALQRELSYVGPLTAAVIVNELGDVTRFRNARSVAAYAGLVPRVNQSGETAIHGGLTRRGNRELRHVIGEWAVRLMTTDLLVREWAKPKLRRIHKNKVRIALARRLLIGVYMMLRNGEPFSMEKCLGMKTEEAPV